MSGNNTLFMTPEESCRVQSTVRDRLKKLDEQAGQPWKAVDSHALIQQATSTSLMQDLSTVAFGLGAPKSKETMLAYAVGRPYLPCTTKLQDLKQMKISELKMEFHHRGFVLALRRVSPVAELEASSWAVVQGESSDDVERLELFLHRSKNGRDVLDICSELLVKEPYYTLNNQGERTIRVDHPSDLVVTLLSENPESWRQRHRIAEDRTKAPEKCKEMGNAALKKKDFARAHAYYTQGLHESADAPYTLIKDLYRNRSHVNLLLQRFDEARTDATSSLTDGADKALDAKAYYRAGLAAYSLGDFDNAKYFFEQHEKLQPDGHAKFNMRRIKARLQEQSTGTYEMAKIVHDIIQRNAFGPGQQTEDEDISNASTGLWIRASYMNHSCIPNAKKDYIGDLMIVRAARRIVNSVFTQNLGLQVQMWVVFGRRSRWADYTEDEKRARGQGNQFRPKREKAAGPSKMVIDKAKRLRQGINETYDRKRYKGLPRPGLMQIERWLQEAGVRW
ncbi:hypothetical protein CEP52_014168 [Fusarium oligoseptatum]|uniref:Uncharacterized protein n=1 Tax=Fusarium oligoseptatum TaxID=2604345 RepID=A0A428SPG2_9HYPO|nr:hypothetical protein CEP52_014168 [Fusarium oligoseptatum]